MAENLTPQQQQAVDNRGGRLLVSAAAGSGKTKVLVDRLMGYLTDPVAPANIDEFLMITYTKAAAAELRGKIASKLTDRVAQEPENAHLRRQLQRLYLTKISTVHSFCADVLREYAYRLNIPGDFRVADENECSDLRLRVMDKLLAEAYLRKMDDPLFRGFIDSQGLGRDDRQVPEILLQVYDSARCHLNPDAWLEKCCQMVSGEDILDASETPYGRFLIDQLHAWLQLQIEAIENCIAHSSQTPGFEKQTALLSDTVSQLEALREKKTWDEIVRSRTVDFGRLTFSKNCADESLKERIKAVRDACKKGLEKKTRPFADDSRQVLADLASSADAVRGITQLVQEFSTAFDASKRSRRILDFGDLEHKMLDLLLGKSRSQFTSAADEIGSRFREVMVDEYQDSNAVQDAIYNALTYRHKRLFMVGDVKQSIYQFRLADPGIFLQKYQKFLPADQAGPGEDRKVVLSRNFRSGGGVLEACNDVFRTCMCPRVGGLFYGAEEALYEGLAHVPMDTPEAALYCVDVQQQTYPEEAAFVAAHIREQLAKGMVRAGDTLRPVQPEDIVILLRSPGSAGSYFQKALDACGIRYATGGGIDLLKTQEVGTLHAILQSIHNPRLDIPLVAAMSSPVFGFTADDLAALRSKNKSGAFYDALLQDQQIKSRAFLKTLQKLRAALRRFSLTGLLEEVLLTTSMEEIYGAMDNSQSRLKNLQTFYQLAADFEAGGNHDLGRFLEHLDAMSEKGLISAEEQGSSGCVTIMSIHKSKGLEFPVVYLCGLGREFNMESQRAAVLCHKSMGLGLSAVDNRNRLRYPTVAKRAIAAKMGMDAVSEELRVLYVAMTRARDRLIMTYASNRLKKDLSEIVQRLDIGGQALLTEEAVCPGDWVLLTALQKTEAGELFAISDAPRQTATGTQPWEIRVVTAPQPVVDTFEGFDSPNLPQKSWQEMEKGLSFRYPKPEALLAPSKQTATGLKGRRKDEEAAEDTPQLKPVHRQWRKPMEAGKTRGTDYGNAMHAAMQYLDYSACTGLSGVDAQLQRLVRQQYLSQQQAALVNRQSLAAFFATPMGQKLQTGHVVREFKFSVLQDASLHDPALAGEQILLQGVVDCALIEEDGIIVLDFKTDYVTEETLPQKLEFYSPQIKIYAEAMQRIFRKPAKQRLLYFFHLNQFVEVP